MRRSPQRSCIGCRTVRPKLELVRIVHSPGGRFLLDRTGKLAGRGAYLCPSPACLQIAVKRKSFDRAFRQAVPKEELEMLTGELANTLEDESQDKMRAQSGAAETRERPESR